MSDFLFDLLTELEIDDESNWLQQLQASVDSLENGYCEYDDFEPSFQWDTAQYIVTR